MTNVLREILVFEVGGQRYGLPVADVQELVRMVSLTPLAGAPAMVEGVINLRGQITPVLDIRARFHLPAKTVEPGDHLVVARLGDRRLALRVDRALELLRLGPADIANAEGVLPGVDYVAQVAKLPDGLALIHDLRTFLSAEESGALRRALAQVRPAAEEGQRP
ncbi:MAG TPA: chemotaxis protein CheW [Gemmataceae bacterium]|jgi:purine-binding chemotaxis protein CheW|nr:chemotaxis protein CheW [Gemmataceae bacterium]